MSVLNFVTQQPYSSLPKLVCRLTNLEVSLTAVRGYCFPAVRKPALDEPFKYAKFCVHFLESIVYARYIFITQERQDSPLMVPLLCRVVSCMILSQRNVFLSISNTTRVCKMDHLNQNTVVVLAKSTETLC